MLYREVPIDKNVNGFTESIEISVLVLLAFLCIAIIFLGWKFIKFITSSDKNKPLRKILGIGFVWIIVSLFFAVGNRATQTYEDVVNNMLDTQLDMSDMRVFLNDEDDKLTIIKVEDTYYRVLDNMFVPLDAVEAGELEQDIVPLK